MNSKKQFETLDESCSTLIAYSRSKDGKVPEDIKRAIGELCSFVAALRHTIRSAELLIEASKSQGTSDEEC